MYVTPKMAAGMVCPMRISPNFTGQNSKCIGPSCMAWRLHPDDEQISERLGFCGLGGDPHQTEAIEQLTGELRVYNHFNRG